MISVELIYEIVSRHFVSGMVIAVVSLLGGISIMGVAWRAWVKKRFANDDARHTLNPIQMPYVEDDIGFDFNGNEIMQVYSLGDDE